MMKQFAGDGSGFLLLGEEDFCWYAKRWLDAGKSSSSLVGRSAAG